MEKHGELVGIFKSHPSTLDLDTSREQLHTSIQQKVNQSQAKRRFQGLRKP
jgi:hypothetical protein